MEPTSEVAERGRVAHRLRIRLGRSIEADAKGWGVAALLLLAILAAALWLWTVS